MAGLRGRMRARLRVWRSPVFGSNLQAGPSEGPDPIAAGMERLGGGPSGVATAPASTMATRAGGASAAVGSTATAHPGTGVDTLVERAPSASAAARSGALGVVLAITWATGARAQFTERISINPDGVTQQDESALGPPALSADGRIVAFVSDASNLLPPGTDTNGVEDVFVVDLGTGALDRVSVATNGDQGNGASARLVSPVRSDVDISDDGRLVVFSSSASNLVQGDCSPIPPPLDCDGDGAASNVFLHDRATRTTRRLSAQFSVHEVAISGNGRIVAWQTGPRFVDLLTGTEGGPPADGGNSFGPISMDHSGTKLVYASLAQKVPADTDNQADIYVYDRGSGGFTLVSVADDESDANGPSFFPAISGDGRYIAFYSQATNLIAGGSTTSRLYIRDLVANTTIRIDGTGCVPPPAFGCTTGTDTAFTQIELSHDGRFVAFDYSGNELFWPGDNNLAEDVYLYDQVADQIHRISVDTMGGNPDFSVSFPSISADGALVGFQSFATDLVAGDTNNRADVFVGTPAGAATVAQPIQAVVNRVPRSDGEFGHSLVAGKELVLRTYVRTRRSLGPSHDAMVEVCVDGDVDACPAGKSFQAMGQAWAFGTQFTESNRRNAVESINVFLRNGAEAVLTPGVHAFEIRISPSNPGSFPVVERTLEGLFHVGKSIDLYQYPVVLEDMAMNAISPSAAVLDDGASMVRATYPVDENQVQNLIRGPEKFADLPTTAPLLDAAKRNLALAVARRLVEDRKTGSGSVVFGAGVLPGLVDGSSPIPGTIGYTYRDLAGVVVSLDLDPDSMVSQIASTMAHELGHQLGFGEEYCFDGTPGEVVLETPCAVNGTKFRDANPPPQRQAEGDEVGNHVTEQMLAFDVKPIAGGRAAVFGPPGSPYYGYVGAGDDTTSWTTAKEYDFLYRTLTTPPPGPAVARGLAPRTILFITGTIDAAGTATLDPFLIFETDDEYPAPPPGDTYTLEILDGNEQVLATLSFDLTFEQEIHAGEDTDVVTVDVTPFSLAIDLPQGAAAVRLREGGSALAEVEKSANAPSVSWVGVVEQVGNVRVLEWMGSDLDGDEVTYTLLYSPHGTVLETLAMDLTGTTFSFDLDDVTPLTFGGFLRVRASDGWNTAEADFPIGPAFAVLDVDANGAVQALTDGLLVLRRMFGLSGTALTGSALGAGCTRCDSAAIVAYLDTITAQLDVDGNGSRTALTDGLLVLRHLFGLGGTVLTSGVVGVGCTRCDAAAIVPWLQGID